MKKFLLVALLVIASAIHANAQTVVLPAATQVKVTVPWSLPSNCTTTNSCQFQVFKIQGACPGSLTGSAGWTLVTTTAAQATQYVDTNVAGATQYSYDVEAIPTGSTTQFSGPSNCGTITTLFTPNPPILGTLIAG